MLVKASDFFMPTYKETPHDAELTSHQLMLRSGMIQKQASGLYSYLPLGLRVIQKISEIIRRAMHDVGASELLMPSVQSSELWQETGRWQKYGKELLRFEDRHQRAFCYGPTHEEVVTDLIRQSVHSYKQLPKCVYQIQTKFRDEVRPRFGLMRAREFIMKDAYSFHADQASLDHTYQKMYHAYISILENIGLDHRIVDADTGSIGGQASHEFHILADSGEDVLVYTEDGQYAANLEKASALAPKPSPQDAKDLTQGETRGIQDPKSQWEALGQDPKDCLTTLLVHGHEGIVALVLKGDDTLNPFKAESHPKVRAPLTLAKAEDLPDHIPYHPGFIGPIGLDLPIIVDPHARAISNFCTGANEEGIHHLHGNWERDCPNHEVYDLRWVKEGDLSRDGQPLLFTRGIEVGHIFELGTTYSDAMQGVFSGEDGKKHPYFMGCYGIGVSRLVAAAIEQHHDEDGIRWPLAIAPFAIHILPINERKEGVLDYAKSIAKTLEQDTDYDLFLDDRSMSAGAKFAEADLLGFPLRVIISPRAMAQNQVEIQKRGSRDKVLIDANDVATYVKQML